MAAVGLLFAWLIPARGAQESDVGTPNAPATIDVREDPSGGIEWRLVQYTSPDGVCRDWIAEQLGGNARGMLGSCDAESAYDSFSWSVGGLELGGRWYNVVDGIGGEDAAKVQVALSNGTTAQSTVRNGVWLVVVPGPDPLKENSFDVARIDALEAGGAVLERVTPPSVRKTYEKLKVEQRDLERQLNGQKRELRNELGQQQGELERELDQ